MTKPFGFKWSKVGGSISYTSSTSTPVIPNFRMSVVKTPCSSIHLLFCINAARNILTGIRLNNSKWATDEVDVTGLLL